MISHSMTFSDLWPQFQGHDIFEVEYRKTKLLLHNGKLPIIWNGTMFGDLDWPASASRRFVSISWASCYVLLEDQDANVIIALALHSALLQLGFWNSWPTLYCWSDVRSVAQAAWQAPWNWTHLSPGPWLQAKTQQPIGVVGPVIIHVNGLAIWLVSCTCCRLHYCGRLRSSITLRVI